MKKELYTFNDVRTAICCCGRRNKRELILKISDFCGNWNIHRLLNNSRGIIKYSIHRSLAYEFEELSKNSKEDFYKILFNILNKYFDDIAGVLNKSFNVQTTKCCIGQITASTYTVLRELFECDTYIEYNFRKSINTKHVSKSMVTTDGMIVDIKWV